MRPALHFERIRAPAAAAILGLEVRTVQALAARGSIPGAAKLGGTWTFDETALRNWIRERSTCQTSHRRQSIPSGAATRYGRGSRSTAESIEKACEQALRRLRRGE